MISFLQTNIRRIKHLGSLLFLLAIVVLNSCVLIKPNSGPLVTPNPNATATPTPFSPTGDLQAFSSDNNPLAPPLPLADSNLLWGAFPGPTESSAIEIPQPMPLMQLPPNTINIIILGSDERPGFYGNRTDAIMILSLNPETGKAVLFSIPRDLYVYIPGWKVNRINTTDQHGGPELVALTILYNLGLETHHWARVSFNGFITAVNMLDGIDISVEKTIVDTCDEKPIRFPAGTQHMDGYTALCYARVRLASSDFERILRQQQVVEAIFYRVFTLHGLTKIPELFREFGSLVETDIGLGDIIPLVPLAATLANDPSRIDHYSIDRSAVTSYRVPSTGAAVLLPNSDAINKLIKAAFGP